MRLLTGTVAVVLASMIAPAVALAGSPVVVDREGSLAQVQNLQAQLTALDQSIYALRPQNPQAIDQIRVALQQAMQQAQQIDKNLKQAPLAPAPSAPVVIAPQPPPRRWGEQQPPPPVYPPGYPQQNPPPGEWGREHHHHDRAPAGPVIIDEGQLRSISGAIQNEAFSEGKINVLTDAVGSWMFTVDQVKRLIALYTFSADKIQALRLLAPRIADRQNNFKIYDSFTFSGDKDQARRILNGN